jgi:hypothetical protein
MDNDLFVQPGFCFPFSSSNPSRTTFTSPDGIRQARHAQTVVIEEHKWKKYLDLLYTSARVWRPERARECGNAKAQQGAVTLTRKFAV